MQLNSNEHTGSVKSITHETALVQEPIELTVEGKCTTLTLDDAKRLMAGLSEAISLVDRHEASLKGEGETYNLLVIGSTRSGMSVVPWTKLGSGGAIQQILMQLPPEMRTPEAVHTLSPSPRD